MVYSHNRLLLCNTKEQTTNICNMGESQKHSKWKKPDIKAHSEFHLLVSEMLEKVKHLDKKHSTVVPGVGSGARWLSAKGQEVTSWSNVLGLGFGGGLYNHMPKLINVYTF